MPWFRHRSTSTKLMLAFGVMSLLLASIGSVSMVSVRSMHTMLTTLHERDIVGLAAIKDVNIALVAMARDTRGALMPVDTARRRRYVDRIEASAAALQKHMATYTQTVAGTAMADRAVELDRLLGETVDNARASAKLALAGDTHRAIATQARAREAAGTLYAAMGELAAAAQERVEQGARDSDALSSRAQRWSISLTIVAIVVAVGLGLAVARMIARPLEQATDVRAAAARATAPVIHGIKLQTFDGPIGRKAKAAPVAVAAHNAQAGPASEDGFEEF